MQGVMEGSFLIGRKGSHADGIHVPTVRDFPEKCVALTFDAFEVADVGPVKTMDVSII
jgi:hypothetical protein